MTDRIIHPQPYLGRGHACIGCGTDLEEHPELIPYEDIRHKVKSGMLSGRSLVVLLKRYGMRWSQQQAAEAWRRTQDEMPR